MKLKHIDLILYTGIACVFARRIWKRCCEPIPGPSREVRIILGTNPPGAFLAPFSDIADFRRLANEHAKRMAAEYRRQRRPLDYDAVPTCGSC